MAKINRDKYVMYIIKIKKLNYFHPFRGKIGRNTEI